MVYRDHEARRAYERGYYAQHRDKILARRAVRTASRTPEERRQEAERRKSAKSRPGRSDLAPERLELLRARDRERKRRRQQQNTPSELDARRARAREADRRWRQGNGKEYAPRRRLLDRHRYAANRESVLSTKRQRYASDAAFAEAIRASNRSSYGRNLDKRRETKKRYYQEHGDELRARQRAQNRRKYAKDPRAALDYYKQWRLRNLERARAYVRVAGNKRRAAAAGTHFTFEEWETLLVQHAGRCAYCGSAERIEADHRTALCRGGSNEICNILPACRHCNRRKHRRTEEEFRALLQSERRATLVAS